LGGLSGVGLSLVEVPRFRAALERRGEAFAARIFTPAELDYARGKRQGWQNLAARFAAKLAGRQALRPALGVEPRFAFRLSLSHDADFALASVLAEPGA